MKDTFYFSHDYNARNDIKIKKLIQKHGMSGYGIFWSIVEDLYNNANALPTDYESIAYDLRADCDIIISIINDFDLFVIDGNEFGSSSIENRLNERNEKSKKARNAALSRWNKSESNANVMQTHSEGNAIKERKGKEIKGKDIKENKINKDIVIIEKTEVEIAFENFKEMRKASRKPLTKRAEEMIKTRLKELSGNDMDLAVKILNQSTMNNWASIYELKKEYNGKTVQETQENKIKNAAFSAIQNVLNK